MQEVRMQRRLPCQRPQTGWTMHAAMRSGSSAACTGGTACGIRAEGRPEQSGGRAAPGLGVAVLAVVVHPEGAAAGDLIGLQGFARGRPRGRLLLRLPRLVLHLALIACRGACCVSQHEDMPI